VSTDRRPQHPRRGEWIGLGAFLALCLGVSALGGLATASSVGTWYQALQKPAFNPPNWVFAPVWTTLYVMIAVSGWRVWRLRRLAGAAIAAYAAQLALNLAWSLLFFGGRLIGVAFAEILLLFAAILLNIAIFWRADRAAALLLVPYAAWVAFASVLNLALWRLN
jgi:benzodiazapine receptor